MGRLVLLLVLCGRLASAWAQALPDAGAELSDELEVSRTDAGLSVEQLRAPDAGQAPTLVPPSLIADSPATYPPEARGTVGDVTLELLIDETGEVASAEVKTPVSPPLDRAALHAAMKLKFEPARVNGIPVAVRLLFVYRFQPPAAPEPQASAAPHGTLKGHVRSKGTRAPVLSATIRVEGVGLGAEADEKGDFALELPPGEREVTVSAPGFKPSVFSESVSAGEAIEVVYSLEPDVVNPYETVVRGERVRTEVARITLNKQELREVPGTMGDPFRVVMLMPGVSSVVSGLAYPVVRGSQPAATGYFLDNIRVPILFHLFLGPAVVHPDFIDSIDFFPGAAPPLYGRLLGGVIDGRISRPRDQGLHGSVYADLINAGVFVEYPIQQTGTSISLAGRYSYTPWLLSLVGNAVQPAAPSGKTNPKLVLDFYDYQARIEQKIAKGRLRLFAFGSSDLFGTRIDPETSAVPSGGTQAILFHRVDLRYQQPIGKGELTAGVTWGLDRLEFQSTRVTNGQMVTDPTQLPEPTETVFRIDETKFAGRLNFNHPISSDVRLVAGADIDHRRSSISLGSRISQNGVDTGPLSGPVTVFTRPAAIGTFTGGYLELVWTRVKGLVVVSGVRVDNYHLSNGPNHIAVEPRLTARYALSETFTLKGGGGFYHQPPTTLINLPVVDVAGLQQGLQEALQFDVGAEWKLFKGLLELNVDVYANPLLHTIELDVLGSTERGIALPTSHGLAYGVEIMLRHPIGNGWFGWLSYTLQRSTRFERWSRFNEFGDVVGASTGEVPFVFDQTHVLNFVLSYKFRNNITAGVSVHFNTGRPEAGGITSRTQREGRTEDGVPRWVPVDRDKQDRLPPFFRVDARVAKAWAFDTFSLELYLDVLNATISQETVAFDYRDTTLPSGYGQLEKIPTRLPIVLPTLGLKASF